MLLTTCLDTRVVTIIEEVEFEIEIACFRPILTPLWFVDLSSSPDISCLCSCRMSHHHNGIPMLPPVVQKHEEDDLVFGNMGIQPAESLQVLRNLVHMGKVSNADVLSCVVMVRQHAGGMHQQAMHQQQHQQPSMPAQKPGRAHKHPDAPKRFKSPYICFFSAKQDEVRHKLGPDAKFQDHGKEIGRMWRELGDEERSFWVEQSRLDRERFEREKDQYEGPWTVESQRSTKRKGGEMMKPPGNFQPPPVVNKQPVPKGHKTAYILFFSAHQQQIKDEMAGEFTFVDLGKKIGEKWRSLSPEERQYWEEQARLDKIRVEKEQHAYEMAMGQPMGSSTKRSRKAAAAATKRPMSAFFHFAAERRKQVVHEHPGKTSGEISKILSEQWKTADEETKRRHYDWRENEKLKIEAQKMGMAPPPQAHHYHQV
jgi:hypothetical protein